MSWRDFALCRNLARWVDFFPSTEDEKEELKARKLCAQCPVRVPCFEWGWEHSRPHGIWGGTTETDRGRPMSSRNRAVQYEQLLEWVATHDPEELAPPREITLRPKPRKNNREVA